PSATATETAEPIPGPPLSARTDPLALATLHDHPELFKIVTPINIDRFEALLTSHPNRPFVESVLCGLREGFWPFAEGDPNAYPVTRDFPERRLSPEDLEFAERQCLEEEHLERFSPPFGSPGSPLLPGMCNVPVHAVPKKSGKLRLVVDHSAGEFSPNSHIDRDDVHVRLDTVQHLAHNLIAVRQRHGSIPIWLWKSDVQQAYRRIPMHPLWQLRQIVTVNGVRRVDRCNNFGGRASAKLWCAFMSLVLWIGVNVMLIEALLAYIDDSYSFDLSAHLMYYAPYDDWYPASQVRFLQLWDWIGLPHEKAKQEFGRALVIIGLHVDPIRMTVSLPVESLAELVAAIHAFLDAPGRKRRLIEWQRMLGWMNWALNVAPLLRPALSSAYTKISGRSIRNAPIYINADVTKDWLWFADTLQHWSGVHIMRARHWPPADADLTVYCDASSIGMGFWAPARSEGFVSTLPPAPPTADTIFWFEAICVLAALEWVSVLPDRPQRLAIYTDNLNTVQIFNSFKALGAYNDILLCAARLLIDSGLDLRVFHIAGEDN
ncbi:DNA/RNA polymerase, partial [Auriscalpium vulgare]